MKIYTKGGDAGETGLLSGRRVPKDDARVASYGEIDELNALLGMALAGGSIDSRLAEPLRRIQAELFTLGSVLAAAEAASSPKLPKVKAEWVAVLEREIDAFEAELPPLRQFVLPGGTSGAGWLHFARTVCRRAERSIVALARGEAVDPELLRYVNRLSDWLFMAARAANHRAGVAEITWQELR